MKKGLLFFFVSFLGLTIVFSQKLYDNWGFFTKNYSPFVYNGSEQNWSITQDDWRVMYFANNSDGIIEYDGVNWKSIDVK